MTNNSLEFMDQEANADHPTILVIYGQMGVDWITNMNKGIDMFLLTKFKNKAKY
eukprot:CAMPEP_0116903498 /NCGR_PEP_ID=MMETSP0467-20121206/10781_1 /TAXON_ID=283647 /ORGANISM="Mesodinium pulex, Strain SPMC105" /LENGTH=53 /DNA_ID=CAMNT_0004577807 /DNA_START=883 /DNA_END=1044 /DNA_ORIENTATION=+